MLEQFQQAFADLTASSDLVEAIRKDPEILNKKYNLSEIEFSRLRNIANQKGMECNCMLYRANRLIPVVMNLPKTCAVLDDDLKKMVLEYWAEFQRTDVHFLLEAQRFCEFVTARMENGDYTNNRLKPVLEKEMTAVAKRIRKSYRPTTPP